MKDKFKTIESVPRKLNNYFITDKKSLNDEDDYFEKLRENINQELDNNINLKLYQIMMNIMMKLKKKEKDFINYYQLNIIIIHMKIINIIINLFIKF